MMRTENVSLGFSIWGHWSPIEVDTVLNWR